MASYELAEAADADLQAIASYTVSTWGVEQARRYELLLENHFSAIARQAALSRVFLKHCPELLVSRCEHRYVFHLVREKQGPSSCKDVSRPVHTVAGLSLAPLEVFDRRVELLLARGGGVG